MFKKISNKKAYSLLELIIVIGLIAIVSVPLFMTFTTGLTIFETETNSNNDVDRLRNFQINFNELIRSSTIGDIKYIDSKLIIKDKTYVLKDNKIISIDKLTNAQKILLEDVLVFNVQSMELVNEKLSYFELDISVKDNDKTFNSKTSYKIRGDY